MKKQNVFVYPVKNGLYVNLTNRCPCACTFCIRQNGEGAYGSDSLWLEHEPSVEEVVEAIERANVASFKELVFCGYGEPTERLEVLIEVARCVKAAHPTLKIRVNTNGLSDLIAGRSTAADFAGVIDEVSVSLNAPSAEEYVAICRPKYGLAAYEAMLSFVREVRAVVPSVMMTVVATADFTDEKRKACERICADLGVPLRIRSLVV